jgi:hypothetical protein
MMHIMHKIAGAAILRAFMSRALDGNCFCMCLRTFCSRAAPCKHRTQDQTPPRQLRVARKNELQA